MLLILSSIYSAKQEREIFSKSRNWKVQSDVSLKWRFLTSKQTGSWDALLFWHSSGNPSWHCCSNTLLDGNKGTRNLCCTTCNGILAERSLCRNLPHLSQWNKFITVKKVICTTSSEQLAKVRLLSGKWKTACQYGSYLHMAHPSQWYWSFETWNRIVLD